ncbi:MAG: HD domain-containing protein [Lysobacterales bacterium]
MSLSTFNAQPFHQVVSELTATDPAHDIEHIQRVVANASRIGQKEQANMAVVLPAAWLHDCISLPKNSPDRAQSSTMAAAEAHRILKAMNYPEKWLADIEHAIEAHSFSAAITPRSLEAKVVQDADRLDGIGAIGIARCFAVGGVLGSSLYCADDPFCEQREPADKTYCVDHFYQKLLGLCDTMQTTAGAREAQRRTRAMQIYLRELQREISLPAGVSS